MNIAVSNIQRCIEDIRIWMKKNFLKLNDDKTEVFVFGSRQQMSKITIPGVRIGDSMISPASSVRNLGGMFDTEMSMSLEPKSRTQINTLCNAPRYHIRSISKIRRYIERNPVKRLFTRLSPRDSTWTTQF